MRALIVRDAIAAQVVCLAAFSIDSTRRTDWPLAYAAIE